MKALTDKQRGEVIDAVRRMTPTDALGLARCAARYVVEEAYKSGGVSADAFTIKSVAAAAAFVKRMDRLERDYT